MKNAIPVVALLIASMTLQAKGAQEPLFSNATVVLSDCKSVARYARTVSLFRHLGKSIEEIDSVVPKPTQYPVEQIKRLVYADVLDANSISLKISDECNSLGYYAFTSKIRREEIVYNIENR